MGYQPRTCACGRSGSLWRWHRVKGKLVCNKCYEKMPSHLRQALRWLFSKWGHKIKPRHEHLEEYHASLSDLDRAKHSPKRPKAQAAPQMFTSVKKTVTKTTTRKAVK